MASPSRRPVPQRPMALDPAVAVVLPLFAHAVREAARRRVAREVVLEAGRVPLAIDPLALLAQAAERVVAELVIAAVGSTHGERLAVAAPLDRDGSAAGDTADVAGRDPHARELPVRVEVLTQDAAAAPLRRLHARIAGRVEAALVRDRASQVEPVAVRAIQAGT